MSHDSSCDHDHHSGDFLFGLVFGLVIGAILAIVIYKNDKNEVVSLLKNKIAKLISSFSYPPSSGPPSPSLQPSRSVHKRTIPIKKSAPKTFRLAKKK